MHAERDSAEAPPSPPERGRIRWLDVTRGIGIILVVAGHVWQATQPDLKRAIYAFHMPLFFLLSGYLTSGRGSWWTTVRHKTQTLLIPYLCWLLLLGSIVIGQRLAHRDIAGTVEMIGVLIWGGAALTAHFGAFWFITCLYIAQLLYAALLIGRKSPLSPAVIAAVLISTAAGLALSPFHLTPEASGVALVSLLFIWAGHALRTIGPRDSRLIAFAVALALVSLVPSLFGATYDLDLKTARYQPPIGSLGLAVGLSLLVLLASKAIDAHLEPVAKLLAWLGTSAITIVFVHQAVHYELLKRGVPASLQFLAAIAIPLLLHQAASSFPLTRRLLLGHPDAPRPVPRSSG